MENTMLVLHVISGFAALGCGATAMFTKKGKGIHVYSGRIYFWSMIFVAISALYLAIINTIPFLFLIAIFSYYLTWTGYKNIHWKNKALPVLFYWFDAVITHLATIFGILMVVLATLSWMGVHLNNTISSLSIVLLIFGIGTVIFAGQDLKMFYKKNNESKFLWMYLHIGRMLGAYIATFTAFLVVNDQYFSSPLVAWLAPTVFGTPLIFYWIRKYKLKMEPDIA